MVETTELGARLRAARKSAGYKTSKQFLKQYKFPASTYSQHESGARQPDDEILNFYCKAFDVNFNWLKNGKGKPFGQTKSVEKKIIDNELLDIKLTKNKFVVINEKLLSQILEEIMQLHQSVKADMPFKIIANSAASIYNEMINNNNKLVQSQYLNKLMKNYKKKYL